LPFTAQPHPLPALPTLSLHDALPISLDIVTYTEICNLAYQGAKVVHPRAVEIAMQAKIPMRVRSTYSMARGTLVTASRVAEIGMDGPDQMMKGIAHKTEITTIQVEMK